MTLDNFKESFYLLFSVDERSNPKLIRIATDLIRRSDNKVIHTNVQSLPKEEIMDDFLEVGYSILPYNWADIIESSKRAQCYQAIMIAGIPDFFPRDSSIDISDLYS